MSKAQTDKLRQKLKLGSRCHNYKEKEEAREEGKKRSRSSPADRGSRKRTRLVEQRKRWPEGRRNEEEQEFADREERVRYHKLYLGTEAQEFASGQRRSSSRRRCRRGSLFWKFREGVTPTNVQQVALTLLYEYKGQFNMIITSDQNQEMDCHSFIQRIRVIQEDIPIIVISSLESNADQGLKTLFDSACYVIKKPVTENTLWGVWQQHQMRRNLVGRREVQREKGQLVIENVEENESSGGNGNVKEGKREENRKLKRSKPCEDEEEEVARKKGKSIAEPNKMNGKETIKRMDHQEASYYGKKLRPTFDPQHHKLLMEAIAYGGPTKNINMTQYLPSMGQQEVPTIADRHGRARAPWSQHLYDRFEKAMSHNIIPGYGVQQAHPYQMMCQRLPPSWVSPTDWRDRLSSEFLDTTSELKMGGTPLSVLSDHYRFSTSISGGLNAAEYRMPMNPNMAKFNGFSSSVLGMNGMQVNGMDQNMNQAWKQSNPIALDGFNNGDQDGNRFGSYGHYNSLLSVVHTDKGNTQMEKQLNESIGYGQSFASRLPITNPGSFAAVEGNIFQSTNSLLSSESQTTAYNETTVEVEENVNQEAVMEKSIVTNQALGTPPTNLVEASANEPSNEGLEEVDITENLNPDVDEFAEFFSFLESDPDEGGRNSGSDEAKEVEGDIYFDIDSFAFSCGDPKM